MKAIKLLILVLAGVLLLAPTQVTAKHKTASYKLPHEVANYLEEHKIVLNRQMVQVFNKPGCDMVATYPAKSSKVMLFGYLMVAKGEGEPRLVAVELWTYPKNKVFSHINKADYNSLKACYEKGAVKT